MNRAAERPLQLGDLRIEAFQDGPLRKEPAVLLSTHEMILNLVEHEDGLTIHIRFDLARFDQAAAEFLLRSYGALLGQIIENADITIEECVERLTLAG